MANKATKDITGETALNAVEEALSVDFTDGSEDLSAIEAKIDDAASELKKSSNTSNEAPESLNSLSEIDSLPPVSPPPAAANDELNPELASLIYSIQQKPSSNIFLYTLILSVIWLAACGYYGYQNILPTIGEGFNISSFFASSTLMTFTAVTLLPLLPLWAFATLVRRSQEMRHAANSMTEAAIQLLQPENVASNSVATVGRAIRREVTAMGDGVERAIARAGELEFMVQKEVMNLERSYGDSEVRLRRLVDEIGTERDTMVQHADKLKSAISDTHTNLTSDIAVVNSKIEETLRNATMSMSDTLELRSDTITSKLAETSEGLISLLGNTGDSLNAKIAAAKEDLELNVSQTTERMASTITTNGKAVARLLETRTAGLQQATAIIDEKLEKGKQEFEQSFGTKTEEFTNVINAAGNSVNSLLKSTTSEIAEQSNSTIQKIEEGRTLFRKEMSQQTVEFANMVESTGSSIKSVMDASASDVAERNLAVIKQFEDSRIALNQDLAEQSKQTAQSLSQVGDIVTNKLEATTESFEKKGDDIVQQMGDNLSIRASEFANQVSQAGDMITTSLEGKLSDIDDKLTTDGNKLVGALGMHSEALGKVLKERTDAIGQTIGERLSGFGKVLTDQVDGTVTKLQNQADVLNQNTKSVEEIITTKTKQVEEAVKSSTINFAAAADENLKAATQKSAEINEALSKTSAELTGSIDKASSQLTAKLGTTTKTLTDALENTSDLMATNINTTTEKLANTLETTTTDLTSKLSATTNDLNTAIDSNRNALTGALDAKKEEFANIINEKTESFSYVVDGTTESFSKAIEERANNLSSKLSQGAHQISSALEEKTKAATDRMESSVKALDDRLSENSNTIENQFAAGNQILEEKLVAGKDELLSAISQSLTSIGSEIDGKAEKISTLLTNRADHINDKLGNTLVETQRNLEAKTEELNALLSGRTSELATLIDSEAKPIISAIINSGTETSEKLSSLSRMIGEEANTLFSNIGTSSSLLENIIKDASGNLNLMQNTLSKQIDDFAGSVETTKHNLTQSEIIASDLNDKMQNASNDMLIGVGGIAQRFEAQSVILQDATKMIDAAQSNLEVTLDSKQEALQQLAIGLVTHSDQINTNMSSFTSMMNALVSDASSKSKNISSEISSEVSKAIEDATSRFDDAVNAMRSAAKTMRTELEDTRTQMRKGILELPDETEKNASAMRRVVTDQIAALRDLSAIVEKSGRVLDASTPTSAQPLAPQRAYAEPKPVAAQRAPAQASPSVDMALRGTQSALKQPVSTSPSQQQTTSKSSGWVSDLLRRASEEENKPVLNTSDSRSPNQVVDSLNSLSVDIANAIDHETSVELWDRYQRGETNVFTRRLYTLQGQNTFDEIRNKYSRDSNFRTAVDRYINDFEQLLGKETNNGQNQALSQSYLTSDTGKVYTMLAHASGRLGNQV